MSSALQLLQPIFQSAHLLHQLRMLRGHQVLIKSNLFQETLGCGVVVALLVLQVLDAHFVDGFVRVGEEEGHRVLRVFL